MTAAAYLFAHDLLDEGVDLVLQRLRDAGLDQAVMAAAYHHSRDVFPHNPRRKVRYLEGGSVYFHPDLGRYVEAGLQPHVAAVAQTQDPLAALVESGRRRGVRVAVWMVMLHNSRLAFQAPECAPVTVFGDPLLNSLCPANPRVRAFATALAGDVSRYAPDSIKLEAASYMPFDHGYHHERSFVPLSPNVRYLLGVCFCDHCLGRARAADVDGERARQRVAELVGAVFESARFETAESDVEESRLRAECDGELGRYLDMRRDVVSSLVGEIAAAVHAESPSTRVVFLDLSGATLGYATGRPNTDDPAVSIAWRDGVDPAAVAGAGDGLGMLGYFAALDRFEREVAAYQRVLPADRPLEVILRPMPPDVDSPLALADKLAVLRRAGIDDVAFYHYGLMRLESVGWIGAAMATRHS